MVDPPAGTRRSPAVPSGGGRGGPARRAARGAAVSLASLVAGLLLAELAFRLLVGPVSRVNYTPISRGLVMEPTIEGLPFMLRPGGSGVQHFGTDPRGAFDPGATLTYRVNAEGFRGPEVPRAKPPGTVRVVGIGDSFTFGEGVRAGDTYLARLERAFAEARGDHAVQVLNLGVPGWHTGDEVRFLEHVGLAFAPDVVVVGYFLNDAGGATHSLFWRIGNQDERAGRRRLPLWRRLSTLADHVATELDRADMVAEQVASFRNAYKDSSPGWLGVQGALRRARSLGESHGFRVVLVIFPVLWHLSEDYPFEAIHARLRALGQELGLPTLDLLPAFAGHDGPELWVHPNNQHPNELAHAIAADALFEFLTTRGIVALP